jgi:ribose 5-phosphate isomerase B
MRVSLGSDHRGVAARERIARILAEQGHVVLDRGSRGPDPCDYPDIAAVVGQDVGSGDADRGILICGSGVGMSIAANKICGVRAALVHNPRGAEMSRRHNDANVLCLSADEPAPPEQDAAVNVWMKTDFEGGRHATRVEKIKQIERRHVGAPAGCQDTAARSQ